LEAATRHENNRHALEQGISFKNNELNNELNQNKINKRKPDEIKWQAEMQQS
jgi:hypothetical protein